MNESFGIGILITFLSIIFGIVAGGMMVDSIESDVKLEPKIKLVIVDNKVDTLYVYEKK